MNRPEGMVLYDELDLKLGIKSSLPHVKSTLALAILFWECADRPAELIYSKQENMNIVINDELVKWVKDKLAELFDEEKIDFSDVILTINNNQLFKSQMEALIVAFELIWKIAKVNFVDESKPASSERTGGTRYPKKLSYSINADIIHCVIEGNPEAYYRVLLSWIGVNVNVDPECEKVFTSLFTALSEGAIFKLVDDGNDVRFQHLGIYKKALETNDAVDVSGDAEAKGPLRILKSLLADGLNSYLDYSNGVATIKANYQNELESYHKRVETFLMLSATKFIISNNVDIKINGVLYHHFENNRLTTGTNVLLYGVPGSGKSWTIKHEYCSDENRMERLVFHPDYTYSDFIGQILPDVTDGSVSYKFTPGPFTSILKKAYEDPENEYFLIIEEINRGNAPAIFGEVFQLLDRKTKIDPKHDDGYPIGTSEYGITNTNVAKIIYGDATQKVRIPSNLSIIGTMNTSDQNVFTLDTAFQRRWSMRMIESTFDHVEETFKNHKILDTTITWEGFCSAINTTILTKNARITSSEDKRMGPYFIQISDLEYDEREDDDSVSEAERIKARQHNCLFAEKVIKYLWDDAFKFSRGDIFRMENYTSLEQVIKHFSMQRGNNRFSMFKEEIMTYFENSFLN